MRQWEGCGFACGFCKHTQTHVRRSTQSCPLAQTPSAFMCFLCVRVFVSHSFTDGWMPAGTPDSIVDGRLQIPYLRGTLRPCNMSFRRRVFAHSSPCYVQPTLFLSTFRGVMNTGLTHLPWDGPTVCVTSCHLACFQQIHTSCFLSQVDSL